jgi:putative aldouronate transport system permease protein
MSVVIAGIGVIANIVLTVLFAYPLSHKDLPGRGVISFFLFFTMLFNGGLVPTYMVYTNLINVKDTLAGMIVPYLLMKRSSSSSCEPLHLQHSRRVLEAARNRRGKRGADPIKIVLPMSKPIIATIALMTLISYWNNGQTVFIS